MNYQIKPEKHELMEARQKVEETLESIKYTLEKEEDLEINLGYTEKEKTKGFGATGRAHSPREIEIMFNTSVENWKENLEDLTADLYGRTWFYENSEVNMKWQQLLAEITGLKTIEKLKEPRKVEKEDFKQEWAEKKTGLSEEYIGGETTLTWQLKTLIAQKLLEKHELKDLPELKRTEVLEAGDALFT